MCYTRPKKNISKRYEGCETLPAESLTDQMGQNDEGDEVAARPSLQNILLLLATDVVVTCCLLRKMYATPLATGLCSDTPLVGSGKNDSGSVASVPPLPPLPRAAAAPPAPACPGAPPAPLPLLSAVPPPSAAVPGGVLTTGDALGAAPGPHNSTQRGRKCLT